MADIALTAAPVTWAIANQIQGGTARGANGYVEFEAEAFAAFQGGLTWLPSPQRAEVIDGDMTPIDLPINDPDVWNWRVTPRVGVIWPAFHINVEEGGTDLSSAAIVPGKGPVRVLQGPRGGSVVGAEDQGDGYVRFILDDGTLTNPVPVTRGPEGPANQLTVGIVSHGEEASATITGAAPSQRLNLVLPQGKEGKPGPIGSAEGLKEATPSKSGLMSASDKGRLDQTPTRSEVAEVTTDTLARTYSIEDNFATIVPQYVTRLEVRTNDVVQAFVRDRKGFYYASQVHVDNSVPGGHFEMSRLDAMGRVMDRSILLEAGHGGPFGYEETDDGIYFWIWWSGDAGSTGMLRRWKYTPGVTVNRSHPTVEKVPDLISNTPGLQWINLSVNPPLDLVAFMTRVADGGSYDKIELRKFSEYKAGIDNVIATLPPIKVSENGAFQGITATNEYCYVLRGMGTPGVQEAQIQQYRWSDGKLMHVHKVWPYAYGGTDPAGRKAEPEGLFPWWDNAGRMSLMYGFATNKAGRSIMSVYSFAPVDFQGDTGTSQSLQRLYSPLNWVDIELTPGFRSRSDEHKMQTAKDATGLIHIRGTMSHIGFTGTRPTQFGALPIGYWPAMETPWIGYAAGSAASPFGGTIGMRGELILQPDSTNPRNPASHFSVIVQPFQASS
ncbi:phage baseplate protein [Brachybacterium alimentarium]|uniref:phage baseplate protein n=1 Tax=Brachybacterium alimentarium TaxID=47845 RepID=UPI003FD62192